MTDLSLLGHFKELRKRVVLSVICLLLVSILSYVYYNNIYQLFSNPFKNINNSIDQQFFVSSVLEGVVMKLKFSLLCGVVLSFPITLYQILRFVFPGLKKNEKRIIITCLFFSTLLAFGGFLYSYFLLIPVSIEFLVSSHFLPESIGLLLTYSDSIFFVFNLLMYLMLVFQTPILLWILLSFKIIKRSTLWQSSRIIIVFTFIIAAILTPPDLITQIMVALPLSLLFFISLLIAQLLNIGDH